MSHTRRFVRVSARIGYAARGLVYVAVGLLALQAALEFEAAEDVRGALQAIRGTAGGAWLLYPIAVGLIAYSAWRALQSLYDVDGHGFTPSGVAVRIGLLVSAVMHVSLAWGAVQIARRLADARGEPVRTAVARTLEYPAGPALVMIGALVVAGAGVAHIHKGATGGFRRWFDASPAWMRVIDPISRVGLCARGLLFVGVAGFVCHAALTLDPSQARGVQGVMLWVQARIYGRILLGLLALGVLAFGSYSLIEACVRRVGLETRH